MTEQSPWGQPPPTSSGTPTGGPGDSYPPPPPGSPGGTPGGPPGGPPGGGFPPPSYAGGPGGPPPPQGRGTRTWAIVAAVVGAIVVIVALVVTLVVATDDDPEQAQDDPTASSTEGSDDEPTDEAGETGETGEPSTDDPADPADPPADAVVGNGYFFELPGTGWQDAIDEARSSGLGSTLDAIIVLGSSLELAQSNILVEALTAGGAPDLESLEDAWKRNLSGSDGAVPEDIEEITLDGERAIGVRFTDRENVNGVLIDQVVYLALHDGNQYSVALTLPSENDEVSEDDFDKVLDSWSWTS